MFEFLLYPSFKLFSLSSRLRTFFKDSDKVLSLLMENYSSYPFCTYVYYFLRVYPIFSLWSDKFYVPDSIVQFVVKRTQRKNCAPPQTLKKIYVHFWPYFQIKVSVKPTADICLEAIKSEKKIEIIKSCFFILKIGVFWWLIRITCNLTN